MDELADRRTDERTDSYNQLSCRFVVKIPKIQKKTRFEVYFIRLNKYK